MLKLYIIYGRNLSKSRMQKCCQTANPIAVATLHDHQLVFQGPPHRAHANVVPAKGQEVPVVVWEISDRDEHSLDIYEGVAGGISKKEYMKIEVNGEVRDALIYIMDPGTYGTPSDKYLQDMAEGYKDFGLPIGALNEAVSRAYENSIINGAAIYTYENTVEMPEQ